MAIGGTLVNAVVKIVILAATLALVYFFIIKPVLATTENVSNAVSSNINNVMDDVNQAFEESNQAGGYNQVQIKRKITRVDGKDQQRLLRCVQNANQSINRIQRCAAKFSQ